MTVNLVPFVSWSAFLAYLAGDGRADQTPRWVWYRAPLDARARMVRILKVYKNGKVRIDPCSADADAFTADAGHLDRFARKVAQ